MKNDLIILSLNEYRDNRPCIRHVPINKELILCALAGLVSGAEPQ